MSENTQGSGELVIGMDVGSTTVKAVVVEPTSKEILWRDYQRHQTKQPENVLEFLERIAEEFKDVPLEKWRIFLTGSGAAAFARSNSKAKPERTAPTSATSSRTPPISDL